MTTATEQATMPRKVRHLAVGDVVQVSEGLAAYQGRAELANTFQAVLSMDLISSTCASLLLDGFEEFGILPDQTVPVLIPAETESFLGGTVRVVTSVPKSANFECGWNRYEFFTLRSGEMVAKPVVR